LKAQGEGEHLPALIRAVAVLVLFHLTFPAGIHRPGESNPAFADIVAGRKCHMIKPIPTVNINIILNQSINDIFGDFLYPAACYLNLPAKSD